MAVGQELCGFLFKGISLAAIGEEFYVEFPDDFINFDRCLSD